ncbi:MAG: hypothetical protein LBJ63_07535 [Prevotellaceae bacterium]|jgi:hypothetical protein|nr:hypothetical protein [Prevotellaceae bacterium]
MLKNKLQKPIFKNFFCENEKVLINLNFTNMKSIKRKIAALVCGIGLLAGTMGTIATAAEPAYYKIETCVNVCGSDLFCVSGSPTEFLWFVEGVLNWLLGC